MMAKESELRSELAFEACLVRRSKGRDGAGVRKENRV